MPTRTIELTLDRVRELLAYVPTSGFLIWSKPQSNHVVVGQRAGVIAGNGRRYISVDNTKHLAHRLVWFHVKGTWPMGNVVPENGEYDDTRIENLREETPAQTISKGPARKNSKSGVKGVSWDGKRQKWFASITRDYHQVNLGRFETIEDAENAIRAAKEELPDVPPEVREAGARATNKRGRQRKLWEQTTQNAAGPVGWSSIDEFIRDVGEVPKTAQRLAPIDETLPIGPGNFQWLSPCGYNLQTPEGRRSYIKEQRTINPLKFREWELQKKFNIGLAEYQVMFDAQKGVCAICSKPETAFRKGKSVPLAVDHDHTTGKIRGLLCTACNIAIGALQDSAKVIRSAADYLDKYNGGALSPDTDT